ncbi:hypothetical protein H0H93_007654 [Arthromyces matolae]|nr:hypothetical protein H0H93_007654 [Arthromyces matolae]
MDPHAGGRYGAQPSASTSRYTPYSTARRPVRVFKNIESVPDITLNYAQFDKIEPEYSPFSPYGSHLSPPISPSPSATPEIRNPLKRKLEDCSPATTPLNWPPSPSFSVLSEMSSLSSSASKSVNEQEQEQEQDDRETSHYDLDHDFEVAKAMSQRRSLRARTAISYAGCEVDSPQEPIRDKMKARTAGQISSDEFKLHSPSSSPKKRRPRGKTKPAQNAEGKVLCPFSIVCSTPFSRFSDVVRHLEANALHTHTAEARWVCPQCHACLARADSYKRHVNTNACGKRAPVTKHKPSYSSEIETELERIRNSDHPAVCAAKERLR